jgi:Ca2+-binding RTX toxin-like protein
MPTQPVIAGGDDGSNTLNGDSGDDILKGFGGADIVNGGSGHDFLDGGRGADILNGGAGDDTASYSSSNAGVLISLANHTAAGGEAQGDVLSSIENLIGSGYGDGLAGDSTSNVLRGGGGDDVLNGLGGNDLIEGGDGFDVMQGGSGVDTLSYASASRGVLVGLAPGARMDGGAYGDTTPLSDFENLIGSAYGDTLSGNAISNVIEGGDGFDYLYGYGGGDVLRGGNGNDWIEGGEGADHLTGGNGLEMLRGGTGADVFSWFATSETGTKTYQSDQVRDFNFAEGDRIDLLNVDANVYAAGNQAFTFIGTALFSGNPGEVRYFHLEGYTFIEMQTGTSVDVEGVIRLDGVQNVQANWFSL